MDRNFGFNSPAMGGQVPTRSDSSRQARTRVSKKKYTPGRVDDDPNFNPFRPASSNPGQLISNTYEGLGFGNKEFVFGAKKDSTNSHGNMEGDKDKAPIHEMRRLKIGNSRVDEMMSSQLNIQREGNVGCSQKFNGEKLNPSRNSNLQHRSISGEHVAFGDVNVTKFLNEIRKLSMKDSFGRRSENELNNLSIKERMNKLGDDNKIFGVSSSDKSNFVFGRCGSTKMHLDDISKSKIGRLSGRAIKSLPIFTKIRDNTKSDILNGNTSLNVFSGSIPSEFSFQAVRESKVSSNDTLSTSSCIGVQSVTGGPESPSLDWPGKKVEFSFNGTPDSAITHRVEFRTLSLKGSLNRKPETKRDPTKDIRSKKKKGKLKKAISDPLKFGQDGLQENADSSDSYSLTDISPYQETPTKNTFVINYNSIKDHELEEVESWRSINQGSFDSANLEDTCQTSFVFSASSTARVQPSVVTRHQKRKNQTRNGNGSSISTSSSKVSYSCTPVKSFQVCGTSSFLSPSQGKQGTIHALSSRSQGRNGPVKKKEVKLEITSTADINMEAQGTCERWRLRGNQAYASGDFSKAEDCYTQGVSCISQTEKSKTRLRALMLCYSNRAATRMSLGKMREALEDCLNATALDPNFHRAHVRAANCYLALGETENASKHFMKCLQEGSNACVDRKLLVEASEGLEKARKLSNYIKRSAELLERRTVDDAECALAVLTDAFMISSYSEKLLEMKADALLMLQKYEEAIQLCEQTFASAELNTSTSDSEPANFDGSNKQRSDSHRFWRCLVTLKSYFRLGKLEEADNFLNKQKKSVSLTKSGGSRSPTLQSIVSLAATIHELLHLKTVGNEAFQSGKHAEAIEYYTSAISCSVESRPFTAICFCNRAATFQAIGQIVDAIADCNLSVALDGNYEKAISRRALLLEMIRDYEQAASDLQRLISLLMRQMENKINQSGPSDKTSFMNEIRQTQQKLSAIEEQSRKNIPLNMYLILGVDPSSTPSEIKKAYRKAALKHHPDKAGQSLPRNEHADDGREISEEVQRDADRLFKMIGEAYALLSDPGKRSRYDLEEETRNGQNRGNGGSRMKTNMDSQNYSFDRSGNRGQKGDVWRTYGNP